MPWPHVQGALGSTRVRSSERSVEVAHEVEIPTDSSSEHHSVSEEDTDDSMLAQSRTGVRRAFLSSLGASFRPGLRFESTAAASSSKDGWELVVGLEIHAQLKTGRKLFSGELLCT